MTPYLRKHYRPIIIILLVVIAVELGLWVAVADKALNTLSNAAWDASSLFVGEER